MSGETAQSDHLLAKIDRQEVKILTADILYIKSDDDYVRVYLKEGKPLLIHITLKEIVKELPADFTRVHRSYIIPVKKIEKIKNKKIQIGEKLIPIGKTFYEAFYGKYLKK